MDRLSEQVRAALAAGDHDPPTCIWPVSGLVLGMRGPRGFARWRAPLVVGDAVPDRIMAWRTPRRVHGQPCGHMLGQATATDVARSRGASDPTAVTLAMPSGLEVLGDGLAGAVTARSRLLGFAPAARTTDAAASRLAGHRFCADGDHRWTPSARGRACGPCGPCGITTCGTTAIIADTGNHRVAFREAR